MNNASSMRLSALAAKSMRSNLGVKGFFLGSVFEVQLGLGLEFRVGVWGC